jgi:hypothetical protein
MDRDLEIPSFLKRRRGDKKRSDLAAKLEELETQTPDETESKPESEKDQSETSSVKPPVQAYVKAKTSDFIAELEEEIDKFTTAGYKSDFDPYRWMLKNDIKGVHALSIKRRYEPLVEELQEALRGDDDQLKEAYSHVTKKQLLCYVTFVNEILIAADNWNKNAKRKRKPRTLKVKKVSDLVSKLTYCKEFVPLQLVSLPPEKVVGANELWVFDVTYNKLAYYTAEEGKTLSIKGSTIQNFKVDDSKARRIRKPLKVLPQLTGSKMCRKVFNELKTTETLATGRINKNVLLLKVF